MHVATSVVLINISFWRKVIANEMQKRRYEKNDSRIGNGTWHRIHHLNDSRQIWVITIPLREHRCMQGLVSVFDCAIKVVESEWLLR